MTNEVDRDNEDWLRAIAGEPRPDADKSTNAHAAAVRKALLNRVKAQQEKVPDTSDAGYHRLLFRLKREGLLKPQAQQASTYASFFSKPLAIAAVFFLGAIVVFHSYQINNESEDALYKGTSDQSLVRVEDPEKVAMAIANSLKSNRIEFQLIDLPRGSKQFIIPSSPEAITILRDHKIKVQSDTQSIDILIERRK